METATLAPGDVVDAWNSKHPTGSPVSFYRLRLADGRLADRYNTRTRSAAWLLNGRPVINLEGVSGCVCLEHVQPRRRVYVRPNRRGMVNHWSPVLYDDRELEEILEHLKRSDSRIESVEVTNVPPAEFSRE